MAWFLVHQKRICSEEWVIWHLFFEFWAKVKFFSEIKPPLGLFKPSLKQRPFWYKHLINLYSTNPLIENIWFTYEYNMVDQHILGPTLVKCLRGKFLSKVNFLDQLSSSGSFFYAHSCYTTTLCGASVTNCCTVENYPEFNKHQF